MVETQLIPRSIKDKAVISAFLKVPREEFVPEEERSSSYGDHPLPIGHGQTISQPYIVSLMVELLRLKKDARVLEVGTGSGYQAAILAQICANVYSVESIEPLAEKAKEILHGLGLDRIKIKVGDGSCGCSEHGPYDGIIVSCSSPSVPQCLKEQLSIGGRLVIPVGDKFSQMLIVVKRRDKGFMEEKACACVFVPLIGKYGWSEND